VLEKMKMNDGIKKKIIETIDWIKDWAVSRTTGMGSYLPGSNTFLIESLSDSTIYMAFYTISHIVVKYDYKLFTDSVWDYIFFKDALKPDVAEDFMKDIEIMKKEFNYWYPITRVSGKDLVGNHLTMCLLNHAFIWKNEPDKWPICYSINGYMMINGEKMSKSTGNFYALNEMIEKYGVSPVRFTLAESANESISDANFIMSTAEEMKKRFVDDYEEFKIIKNNIDTLEKRSINFNDRVFMGKIQSNLFYAVKAYDKFNFRDALHYSYKMMWSAYKEYNNHNMELNKECLEYFIKIWQGLNHPIIPKFVHVVNESLFNIKLEIIPIVPASKNSIALVYNSIFEYILWTTNNLYKKQHNTVATFSTEVTFYLTMSLVEYTIAQYVSTSLETGKSVQEIKKNIMKNASTYSDNKSRKDIATFVILCIKLTENCGYKWYTHFTDDNKQTIRKLINNNFNNHTNTKKEYNIKFVIEEQSIYQFKYNSIKPLIVIKNF